MIKFKLNGKEETYFGDTNRTLLSYLRNDKQLTAAKDGCSGQASCGACTVEINKKPRMACVVKMGKVADAEIVTLEGVAEEIKSTIGKAFVKKGGIQCGFCTPGIIVRTKILLDSNPNPTDEEIKKALKPNLCRCTGYVKIIDSVKLAAKAIRENEIIEFENDATIGKSYKKYQAYDTAIGKRKFTDDIFIDGMLFGVLKFSAYPRAKILKIDTSKAKKLEGVVRIVSAKDIPGDKFSGLIFKDWPMMLDVGETSRYIGDVVAGVVAESEETARKAAALIEVEYEIYKAVTDVFQAQKAESPQVHPNKPNLLDNCIITIGDADREIEKAAFVSKGFYETQRIEHGFLEKESAVALPEAGGIKLFSQGQGVYVEQEQIAKLLDLPIEKINVEQVANGGGFGGKEDLSVQAHVSLFALLTQKPVKLTLTREESLQMHPKRHPVYMDIVLSADKNGKLTALKLRALGDTGAYASVGNKVMERVAGHATAGYFVPNIDLQAKTVYTNNVPCGAMRGFGANQVNFAIESCIDDICEQGGFDRWQIRYDNALDDGLRTATGQKLKDVGIKKCLEALKDEFYASKYAGIATGIKNSGVGNGMPDFCDIIIQIKSADKIVIHHGWSEMGQGVHNMAIQPFCQETGLPPENIDVVVDTKAGLKTGMTTSSRATVLLGNAVIDAAKKIKEALKTKKLHELVGREFRGSYMCDWTTKPGTDVEEPITHYSYGYAAQLCVLDDKGEIDTFYAAHDAGKIMNQMFFEGQIEGAVLMGIGYALNEELPMKDGFLVSKKLKDIGLARITNIPKIVVKGIEVTDTHGPYGAKGIGEIGLVPTASAVANAKYQFDKKRRFKLPMKDA